MTIRAMLKDWLPPAAVRMGRHFLPMSASESKTKTFHVGSIPLLLPADHALPLHRSHWPLYDTPIRKIADALRQRTQGFCAIDIGANVGDTAAAIGHDGQTPVLCVEGDPAYLWFLAHNAKTIGPHIVIENCFVGATEGQADAEKLHRCQGTTSAVGAFGDAVPGGLPICRLESILKKHPAFENAHLIKIDTDGLDFEIILSHAQWLALRKPVLFFENVVDSPASYDRSLACIESLLRAGYTHFLVFDNYGHFLLSTASVATFRDLNAYLLSNAKFGTAVHYFDICALPGAYRDLVEIFRNNKECIDGRRTD